MTLSYGVGLLGLPLAVFVPPPAVMARRAPTITLLLLGLGIGLLTLAVVVQLLGHWYEGVAIGGAALGALLLTFWASSPRRSDASDEDDDPSNGGGGSQPRGPDDEPAPGGTGVNWGEFDRFREQWSAERPAPSLELV